MRINPNEIQLAKNHNDIFKIFNQCNRMFNENDIEYYYTSGILSYTLVDKPLQRYHHDLDIYVNLDDLGRLEDICGQYGFEFKRVLGDREDKTKRIMIKMYYEGIREIPITLFMYERKKDGTIEQSDFFIDDNHIYVEKMYNSKETVDLSFSDKDYYNDGIKYHAITLEALYLCKDGNRSKDIYDCQQFERFVDKGKLELLKKEVKNNKKNEVFDAESDKYYSFITRNLEISKEAVLKLDRL